jgi:hypothetical protein
VGRAETGNGVIGGAGKPAVKAERVCGSERARRVAACCQGPRLRDAALRLRRSIKSLDAHFGVNLSSPGKCRELAGKAARGRYFLTVRATGGICVSERPAGRPARVAPS